MLLNQCILYGREDSKFLFTKSNLYTEGRTDKKKKEDLTKNLELLLIRVVRQCHSYQHVKWNQ